MSSENSPSITPTKDGPYQVKFVRHCLNRSGEIETRETMYLCRCGASDKKPFCDGSHKKIGFSSARQEGRQDKRVAYQGNKITIYDNRSICAHAGYCTDNLAVVFRMRQEPWIDADAASVEEIIATVEKCPSGALSFAIDEVEKPDAGGESTIMVSADGPYVVSGGVELIDSTRAEGASSDKYTLCRCGASKNKPFCDGSHWAIEFKDEAN